MKRLFGVLIGTLMGVTLSIGAQADARPITNKDKPRLGTVYKSGKVVTDPEQPKPEVEKEKDSGAAGTSNKMSFKGSVKVAKEHLPGYPFVYGAYCFIWAALFFYLWSLRRRQNQVTQEIARLKSRIDEVGTR